MSRILRKYFSNLFVIGALLLILYRLLVGYLNYKEIDRNKGKATGVTTDYYDVGVDNIFLEYSYKLEERIYRKKKTVPFGARLGRCHETKECIGRKFVVYYSIKNPEKSEIDLDQELE